MIKILFKWSLEFLFEKRKKNTTGVWYHFPLPIPNTHTNTHMCVYKHTAKGIVQRINIPPEYKYIILETSIFYTNFKGRSYYSL